MFLQYLRPSLPPDILSRAEIQSFHFLSLFCFSRRFTAQFSQNLNKQNHVEKGRGKPSRFWQSHFSPPKGRQCCSQKKKIMTEAREANVREKIDDQCQQEPITTEAMTKI